MLYNYAVFKMPFWVSFCKLCFYRNMSVSSVFKFTVMKVPNILLLIDLFNLWLLRSGLFSLVNVIDLRLLSIIFSSYFNHAGGTLFLVFSENWLLALPILSIVCLPYPLYASVSPSIKRGDSNSMHSVCLLGGLFELIHARIVLGT